MTKAGQVQYRFAADSGKAVGNDTHSNQTNPALAFDGTRYLVVWEDSWTFDADTYHGLSAQYVSRAGDALIDGSDNLVISYGDAGLGEFNPVVKFDGTSYAVV